MADTTKRGQNLQVRWAVITKIGRVVVEAATADVARAKAERRGYLVLESIKTRATKAVSF